MRGVTRVEPGITQRIGKRRTSYYAKCGGT